MESSPNHSRGLLRNNPAFVITLACLLAILMSSIGFLAYYNSDTRRTVEQIQKNNLEVDTNQSTNLDSGELNTTYIDNLETTLTKEIYKHSDEIEFSASELTDSALGL